MYSSTHSRICTRSRTSSGNIDPSTRRRRNKPRTLHDSVTFCSGSEVNFTGPPLGHDSTGWSVGAGPYHQATYRPTRWIVTSLIRHWASSGTDDATPFPIWTSSIKHPTLAGSGSFSLMTSSDFMPTAAIYSLLRSRVHRSYRL